MIGNDIVDLNFQNTRISWKRKKYLQKIFSSEEIALIERSSSKTELVWRLWSMKEAAYKAHQRRLNLTPKFNPKSFRCTINSAKKGGVKIASAEYSCTSEVNEAFIYSEAIEENFQLPKISEVKKNISAVELKNEVLQQIISLGKTDSSEVEIRKCVNRIPRIYSGETEIMNPVSFTHHGRFSAYLLTFQ